MLKLSYHCQYPAASVSCSKHVRGDGNLQIGHYYTYMQMCTAERTTMTKITPSVDVEGEQHVNGALIFLCLLSMSRETPVWDQVHTLFSNKFQ